MALLKTAWQNLSSSSKHGDRRNDTDYGFSNAFLFVYLIEAASQLNQVAKQAKGSKMRTFRVANRHSHQLLGVLAIAAMLMVLALAPQASAQAVTLSDAAPLPHCIMQVSPLEKTEATSKVTNYQCFATFAEAVYHASGGRVSLPSSISPAELTDAVLLQYGHSTDGAVPYNNYVIGENWTNSGFTGTSLTLYTSEAAMCNGYTYGTNYPSAWDNTISSSTALGNCSWLTQYEYVNFGGALINCGNNFTSCSSMGVMDNAASSWRAHD